MAVASIGHRHDRVSNEGFLSNLTERFEIFTEGEKTYSITSHNTFSIDTDTRLDYQDSPSFSCPSASTIPTEEAHSNSSSSTETSSDSQKPCLVSSSAATSAFLALPLEIRRTIYYYALLPSSKYRQVLRPLRAKWANSWWGTEEMSQILRVNKQLHWETEEVLYSCFEFSFLDTTPYNIEGFLEVLSPRARSLIQHASCSINMNGRIRDSIRQGYVTNWKACLEVMSKKMPSLRKVALQFRFLGGLATSNMRTTFVGSTMDLVSVLGSKQDVSLRSYDGTSPVDKQGAEIVEECRKTILQRRHY